jgi:CBS domain-containing protein
MSIFKKTVGQLCSKKLVTVPSTCTIAAAAKKMDSKREIGSLLITDTKGVVGIVTERDLVQRCIAKKLPYDTPISKVMTKVLVTVSADANIPFAARVMKETKKKKVLIENKGKIIGILTQTDIVRLCSGEVPWKKG